MFNLAQFLNLGGDAAQETRWYEQKGKEDDNQIFIKKRVFLRYVLSYAVTSLFWYQKEMIFFFFPPQCFHARLNLCSPENRYIHFLY